MDEGINLDSILLDQEEEMQPEHHTLEDRLKEGRGVYLTDLPEYSPWTVMNVSACAKSMSSFRAKSFTL